MRNLLFTVLAILLVFATVAISIFILNYVVQSVQAKTNTVVATIPVGPFPYGVAYDSSNKQVYVANTNSDVLSTSTFKPSLGSVSAIDTYNVIRNIPVGNNTVGVAYDSADNRVYVSNSGSQTVYIIDGTTDTHISTKLPLGYCLRPC